MAPKSLRNFRFILGALNLTLAVACLAGSFLWGNPPLKMELRALAVGLVLIGVGCILNARATA